MIEKGINTYNLITSATPLDKQALNYYRSKGEHTKIQKEKEEDNKYLAAFGTDVLRFQIPKNIAEELEKLYQSTKKIADFDLKKASDIFKHQEPIEVTVIKDALLAKNFQNEIRAIFQH